MNEPLDDVGRETRCHFGRERKGNGQLVNYISGHKHKGQPLSDQEIVPYNCAVV